MILCRRDGSPVEASASNLVLLCGDRWVTPVLGRDGLHGIGRAGLIEHGVVEEVVVDRKNVGSRARAGLGQQRPWLALGFNI